MCLFLSGAAGLAYEIAWIRRGALVFGSTTLATSTLLAVFFGGLAAGSWGAAVLLPRLRSPLRVWAGLEIGVAVLGGASLLAFDLAEPLWGALHRGLRDAPVALAIARATVVGAIVLPPTILMGASLPLLCSLVPPEPERITSSVGFLYGANTLGATVGCLGAGFALLPAFGLGGTIAAAAVANLAAAALALASGVEAPPPASTRPASPRDPAGTFAAVAALFFLSGFAGIAYEVLWTRFLGLVLANTVYTYTASLAVVLLGIVIGSLLAPLVGRSAEASGRGFGVLQVLAGLWVLAVVLLPPQAWKDASVPWVLAAFLPPAIGSGASFPLAVRAASGGATSLGAHVGRMAAVNTLGGIGGSLAAGFVGLPLLGLQSSVLLTTGLSVGIGIGARLLFSRGRLGVRELAFAAVAAGAWLAVPLVLPARRVPADFLAEGGVLVDHREGLASHVAVVRSNGLLQLRVDRWWQGGERKTHQALAAHLAMLLHPDARSVLVVGAGAGQTARRFLDHPVERVDVVEIEPAVLDVLEEHFDDGWTRDPRVDLIRDDGRNVVAHGERRYNLVSLEVGQVFRPSVATFYTSDFYRLARDRLNEGGRIVQFVPLAFLTPEELRRVVASFVEVFPESVLWYNTSEVLLIGAREGTIRVDPSRIESWIADPRIGPDLRFSPWGDRESAWDRPDALLAGYLAGPAGLAALSRGAAPYRDDHPVLEYDTARAGRSRTAELAIVPLLREHLDPFERLLGTELDRARAERLETLRTRNLADLVASARVRHAEELAGAGRTVEARRELDLALLENPDGVPARRVLGNLAFADGRTEEARRYWEEALRREPDDAVSSRELGRLHLMEGRLEEAAAFYERAVAERPNDAETRNNLGALLARRGELEAALVHFRQAARLDPRDRGARENLVRVQAVLSRNDPGDGSGAEAFDAE